MYYNKVEICGVNTSELKILSDEEKRDLLDPASDHYAYLKTWGYKLAFCEGFRLADNLLPHLIPAYIPDTMLSMRLERKLWDSLGIAVVA